MEFIIKTLKLTGKERILDLACGYGRHALIFAEKGFEVVGVDITKAYVEDAMKTAQEKNINAKFILSDIRDIKFENELDVVLNLADGAIGYLEDDEENLKIFDVISKALKSGGKHFMDICHADHAENYFPKTNWEIGENALALAKFDWDANTRRMTYWGYDIIYGEVAQKPHFGSGDPTRLYSLKELNEIFAQRNMKITNTFSDYYGNEASIQNLQLMVYSLKN